MTAKISIWKTDVTTDVENIWNIFSQLHPTNYTIDEKDGSMTIKIEGTIKLIPDGINTQYDFELYEKKSESNLIEFLNSLDGLSYLEKSRIINDGKQIEFLFRWVTSDLTFSQLETLNQSLNPITINIYKESEIEKNSGNYHIGLVFDLVKNDKN